MLKYKNRETCRCCGHYDLLHYLNLGDQPLANSYVKDPSIECPTVPLKVNLCTQCYHSQLSAVVDPPAMFDNYLYVSGTTETFRNHTKELAKEAVAVITDIEKDRPRASRLKGIYSVLDIACNDGTQLEQFRDLGCGVYGVDPAKNLRAITEEKKIDVLVDYFGKDTDIGRRFDIITGTNVFAHVDDAQGFLLGIRRHMTGRGVAVIEFPYGREMVQKNEFDTIYHEHLSYFLVNSFSTLANRVGLNIFKITQTKIHGGSIRFYLSTYFPQAAIVSEMIEQERAAGLLDVSTYQEFSLRVSINREEMCSLLDVLRKQKRQIVGYGASAKGNTMLNYFGIDLDYTVDDNPLKWDLYTPGRHVLIKSPQELANADNPVIVVLAWNFWLEIQKRVNKITDKRKEFVMYVPEVMVSK